MSDIDFKDKVSGGWLNKIVDGEAVVKESDMVTTTYDASKKELQDKKPNYTPKPPFNLYGNGATSKYGNIKSMNYGRVLVGLPALEQNALLTIVDLITKNTVAGEVEVKFVKDRNGSNDFGKGARALKKKNLVKSTKRSHYIINPLLVIRTDYIEQLELWDNT